jgi:hypothetical protein
MDGLKTERVLILYAGLDINENLLFFLHNGYIDDPRYDYIFIFNNLEIDQALSEIIPKKPNVRLMVRENTGLDFGAWSHALLSDAQNGSGLLYQEYDSFIFVNSTARGPFLPSWSSEIDSWPELFLSKLTNEVKLVGATIHPFFMPPNYYYFPHVQSMCMATDRIGLEIGIQSGIFNKLNSKTDKLKIIWNQECGFSKAILKSNYNIACLLAAYKDWDFRKISPIYNKSSVIETDHYYEKNYFGININPYEVLFIKDIHNVEEITLETYTNWHYYDQLPKKDILIYLICFDEHSYNIIKPYESYEYVKIYWNKTTKYFESAIYKYLYDNQHEWNRKDYVGTLAYSAEMKLGKKLDTIYQDIQRRLKIHNPDVISLYNQKYLSHTLGFHPNLKSIYDYTLSQKGFNLPIPYNKIPAFYCNYFLAKPDWMLKYNIFTHEYISKLEDQTDYYLQCLVNDDSFYDAQSESYPKGRFLSKEKLNEIIGFPYYSYHTFVLERLPCLYFWHNKAKLYQLYHI